MPVRHVPVPSIPGNFIYVKTITPWQDANVAREIYSDHFFHANGSLTSFNVVTAAATDFLPQWFRPVFSPIRTSTLVNVAYQFFANIGTHVQSVLISPSWPASTNGPVLAHQFKVRVMRRAQAGPDYFWGRFAFPPVPLSFIDGNRLNATGELAYDIAESVYMNTWTSQGLTFTPCGWSRKHAAIYDLVELRRFPLITHDRKTRSKDFHSSYTYRWPTVL